MSPVSPQPQGAPQPPLVRRRRRRKRKKIQIPLPGLIIVGICFLVVVAVPFAGHHAWRFKARGNSKTDVVNARELAVSRSHIDSSCTCIRGLLKNASNKIFNDAQLFFQVRDRNGADLGVVLALTGVVRPHSEVPFSTDAIPPASVSYDLKELKGVQ